MLIVQLGRIRACPRYEERCIRSYPKRLGPSPALEKRTRVVPSWAAEKVGVVGAEGIENGTEQFLAELAGPVGMAVVPSARMKPFD